VPPSDSWRQTDKNAAPQHRPFGPVLNQSPPATSRYYTTSTRQQQGYVSSDRRPARGSTTCRTCTSLAGRCQSPKRCTHVHHSTLATQRRDAQPTTRSLPAELRLLLSERPREICRTHYGPFRGHHPPFQPTSADCVEDLHTPSKTAPFRAIDLSSAGIVLSAP
jgi:hypothetical protein